MKNITRIEHLKKNWNQFFFTGCHPDQLGVFRVIFGFALIPFHINQFYHQLILNSEGVKFYLIKPIWYFQLLGIEMHDPFGCKVAIAILSLASVGFALGLFTRSSLITMLLCILYLKGMRDSISGDNHHRYLIPFHILFIFLFSRCGQIFSLDAIRMQSKRTLSTLTQWEASWPIRAGQLYVASFYFWSAVAKLRNSGYQWIKGGEKLQSLLLKKSTGYGFEDGVLTNGSQIAFDLAHSPFLGQVLGAMTYIFEFGFPIILFIRDLRLRILFFLGVSLFHISNYILLRVEFLLIPIVFLVFFDLSKPLKKWRRRRAENSTL